MVVYLSNIRQIYVGGTQNRVLPSNATQYNILMGDGDYAWGAVDSTKQFLGRRCILSNWIIITNQDCGAGESWIFTVEVDSVASTLTATIGGAAVTTASDLVNQVQVEVGEAVEVECVGSAGARATARATWLIEVEWL